MSEITWRKDFGHPWETLPEGSEVRFTTPSGDIRIRRTPNGAELIVHGTESLEVMPVTGNVVRVRCAVGEGR